VPETARSAVAERVTKGESKKKIAKELGVTPRTVSNIVKPKSQKTSGKESAGDPNAVAGEAPNLPSTQPRVGESSVVPTATLYGSENGPSPSTPFDQVIDEVQAMLENLKPCDELTQKIEDLVPGLIEVDKNKASAHWLTKRFGNALKALEAKAAEYRAELADGEADQDDGEQVQDGDQDEPDLGRPSRRAC
jgi:predicted transcriptional regulator